MATNDYIPVPDSYKIPDGFRECRLCRRVFPETTEYFFTRVNKRGQRVLYKHCKHCHTEITTEIQHSLLQNNPEYKKRFAEYHKNYGQLNAKRIKAYRDQRYRDNPELGREKASNWRKRNPEKYKLYQERRRARKLNLPTTFTSNDWRNALDYFGGCCAVCGRPAGLFHVIAQDHWIPVASGGGYTPDNIIPLCHSQKGDGGGCNNTKSYRNAHEWLVSTFGARKAKKIEAKIDAYFASLTGGVK